jgi:hypothetical protein
MSEIPYTPLTGKIEKYFKKIQEVGVPDKATVSWLKSLGFRTGNDFYILRILRYINFLNNSGVPTDFWKQYKDPNSSKAVLAQAIRSGYAELFETYSDAYRKDREALYSFFSGKTGKSKYTVNCMVNTFVNLCKLADFEKEIPVTVKTKEAQPSKQLLLKPAKAGKRIISEMHINIQLHLPPTDDSAVYDALFKSLRKNLLSEEE